METTLMADSDTSIKLILSVIMFVLLALFMKVRIRELSWCDFFFAGIPLSFAAGVIISLLMGLLCGDIIIKN